MSYHGNDTVIDLPFPFPMYCSVFNSVTVSEKGVLSFGPLPPQGMDTPVGGPAVGRPPRGAGACRVGWQVPDVAGHQPVFPLLLDCEETALPWHIFVFVGS